MNNLNSRGHGGKRPNSGPEKGTKYGPTLRKEAARELAREIITRELEPLIHAQMAHAKGISYLVARNRKSGKFAKLTEDLALAIQNGENDEYDDIEVWTKDPSVQAFTDLLNRALDKPKEQVHELKVTGDEALLARLDAGRQRARTRTKD